MLINLGKSTFVIKKKKKTGYKMNVMRQTTCLVVNPITANNFAALFNSTPADRASNSAKAPINFSVSLLVLMDSTDGFISVLILLLSAQLVSSDLYACCFDASMC